VLVRSLGKEGSGEGGMLSNRRLWPLLIFKLAHVSFELEDEFEIL
jgi:hypothetical protein